MLSVPTRYNNLDSTDVAIKQLCIIVCQNALIEVEHENNVTRKESVLNFEDIVKDFASFSDLLTLLPLTAS